MVWLTMHKCWVRKWVGWFDRSVSCSFSRWQMDWCSLLSWNSRHIVQSISRWRSKRSWWQVLCIQGSCWLSQGWHKMQYWVCGLFMCLEIGNLAGHKMLESKGFYGLWSIDSQYLQNFAVNMWQLGWFTSRTEEDVWVHTRQVLLCVVQWPIVCWAWSNWVFQGIDGHWVQVEGFWSSNIFTLGEPSNV